MKFSFSNKTDIQQTLSISIPSKEIEEKVSVKLLKAQKDSKIKGFRKGKAPIDVVTKIYGPEIRQDVIYDSVQHDFYHQVEDKDLRIVSRPNLIPESMDEGKDVKFKATFEIYPTVKISNLSKLNYKKTTCVISDEDVDNSLQNIQKRMSKWEPVEENSAKEDQIKINFVGKIDGEEFEGGSADDFVVELGSNSMIAGFEDGLVGLKAKDTKTLDLVFPDNYGKSELASKPVQFEVTVVEVLKPSLPELNEEFFKSTGIEAKNINDYKDQVKLKLEDDLKNVLKNKSKQSIFDALADANSFEIPTAMIDSEISNMRTDMARRMGMDPKDMDESLFPESNFKEEATKRVSIGVLLNKIIEDKELKADPDKVKEIIEERAAGYKDPQQVINYFYSDEEQLKNIEGIALEEKVVDVLCSEAKATEEALSYEECISGNQMT
jgi:trigger factor